MNIAEPILKLFRKPSVPDVSVGDVVRVHQKIKEGNKERIQVFEGIVIATHNKTNLDATFTVRKIASGVGVEKTYLLHSPRIAKIEFKRSSDVRRAKLYFLRNLTGKALKMKDKKVTKDSWTEVLASSEPTEATEAEVQEAVVAEQQANEEANSQEPMANSGEENISEEVAVEAEAPAAEVDNSAAQVEDGGNEPTAEEPQTEEVAEPTAEIAESSETAEESEDKPAA
jgi:large subunit ribosomal protein L19